MARGLHRPAPVLHLIHGFRLDAPRPAHRHSAVGAGRPALGMGILRRRTFDHPRVAVAAALVLLAWAALAFSAGAKTRSDSLRAAHATSVPHTTSSRSASQSSCTPATMAAPGRPASRRSSTGTLYATRAFSSALHPATSPRPRSRRPVVKLCLCAHQSHSRFRRPSAMSPSHGTRRPHPKSPPLQVLFADWRRRGMRVLGLLRMTRARPAFYVTQPVLPPFPESERVNVNAAIERARREMKEASPPPARD